MVGKKSDEHGTRVRDLESFIEATGVSRESASRFETWRALLEKWGARINLVSAASMAGFWSRHAYDSAQIVDLVPRTEEAGAVERWADLGSGAGFPGLAAALVLEDRGRPAEVHLFESDQRKAAFLREAARATGARAVVRAMRVEELSAAGGAGERFDVVTARACAPMDRLLGLAAPLWKSSTRGVFLKGRGAEAELTAARKSWRFRAEVTPSRSGPNGRIVLITRLEHAPCT